MYIHFLISEKNKTEILELKRKLQAKYSHITHSTRLFLNENIPFPEQEKELKSFDRKWNMQEKTTSLFSLDLSILQGMFVLQENVSLLRTELRENMSKKARKNN